MLEFLRAFPPPVLVPVLILLAGIGDRTKILVIVSGCVWPVLLNTIEGVRGRDEVLSDTCRSYRHHRVAAAAPPGAPLGQPADHDRRPAGAPASAIILMVISEMMAANEGLGFTVLQFQRGFQIPEMWSGVLLLGADRHRALPAVQTRRAPWSSAGTTAQRAGRGTGVVMLEVKNLRKVYDGHGRQVRRSAT